MMKKIDNNSARGKHLAEVLEAVSESKKYNVLRVLVSSIDPAYEYLGRLQINDRMRQSWSNVISNVEAIIAPPVLNEAISVVVDRMTTQGVFFGLEQMTLAQSEHDRSGDSILTGDAMESALSAMADAVSILKIPDYIAKAILRDIERLTKIVKDADRYGAMDFWSKYSSVSDEIDALIATQSQEIQDALHNKRKRWKAPSYLHHIPFVLGYLNLAVQGTSAFVTLGQWYAPEAMTVIADTIKGVVTVPAIEDHSVEPRRLGHSSIAPEEEGNTLTITTVDPVDPS